jgi:hypothetical protein
VVVAGWMPEVFVMSETKVSPRDHVFAVLPSRDAARSTVEALMRAGFRESIVFEGEDVTHDVDPKGEQAGPLEKVLKAIGDHLSEQPNYLSQYQEEARNGRVVLAVRAKNGDDAQRAADILHSQGGQNIRYFGALAVADLSPLSNPSSRAEESPESDKWSKQ